MIERRHGTKPLVLIVEDDPWLRCISSELLTDEGFGVACAGDGRDGLNAAERLRPAAILLDLGLPNMSGSEFLSHLRARASLRGTPVILVSGQPAEFSQDAIALADGFVRKPFDLTELMQQVQAATAGAIHAEPCSGRIPATAAADARDVGEAAHQGSGGEVPGPPERNATRLRKVGR